MPQPERAPLNRDIGRSGAELQTVPDAAGEDGDEGRAVREGVQRAGRGKVWAMQMRSQLRQEVTEVKSSSYHSKLALWELKNQILELKGVLNEEE